MTPEELEAARLADELQAEIAEARAVRPRTRGACTDGPRPCPWVGCRHHLASEALRLHWRRQSHLRDPRTAEEIAEEVLGLEESCSLDVAEAGPQTLAHVGDLLRVVRERVRQIEVRTLLRMPKFAQQLKEDLEP